MKKKDFDELLESIDEARSIHHGNRIKKTSRKRALVWCLICDQSLVPIGRKCRSCGKRNV